LYQTRICFLQPSVISTTKQITNTKRDIYHTCNDTVHVLASTSIHTYSLPTTGYYGIYKPCMHESYFTKCNADIDITCIFMRIHVSAIHPPRSLQYFHTPSISMVVVVAGPGPATDIIDEISAPLAWSSFCDTIEDGLLSGAETSKPPAQAVPVPIWW
jgi:hypothetical protein